MNLSALPARRRTALPKPTKNSISDSPSRLIARPQVQSARKALLSAQSPSPATPEADPALIRTLPVEDLTEASIAEIVKKRRIEQLIHFTRCENIGPILERGLLSVSDLEMERLGAIRNDSLRLDEKPSAICLSVSFPNHRMFYKYRCERPDADWAVVRLKPAILWELDCLFYEMNAADHRMRCRSASDVQGPSSFAAIFGDVGVARPPKLPPSFPTDVQAEVLVMEPIDPSYILSVAFETQESHRRWAPLTENVGVTIEGRGAGLFGSRERVLAN